MPDSLVDRLDRLRRTARRGVSLVLVAWAGALASCASYHDPDPPAGIARVTFARPTGHGDLERRAELDLVITRDALDHRGLSCPAPRSGGRARNDRIPDALWREAVDATNLVRSGLPVDRKVASLDRLETDLNQFISRCHRV